MGESEEGLEGLTQPSQPPRVSQSTNAATLPEGGEETEREAVFGVETMCAS